MYEVLREMASYWEQRWDVSNSRGNRLLLWESWIAFFLLLTQYPDDRF